MGTKSRLKRVILQLQQMRALCETADYVNQSVSGWSIGQHLEHLALAALRAFEMFERESDSPSPGREQLTMLGRLVFLVRRIKRGVGKSPEYVKPQLKDKEWLVKSLDEAISKYSSLLSKIEEIDNSKSVHPHPYFGKLSLRRWVDFLIIHQDHHLRIITDMQRAA